MIPKNPDVIFIGPYRTGTNFLRGYFTEHPDVYWTRNANFFLADENFTEKRMYPAGVEEGTEDKCYIDMFEGVAIGYIFRNRPDWATVGFTPGLDIDDNIVRPDPAEIAKRIKATIPDGKILLTLRNQIDWMRSCFLHFIAFLPAKQRTVSDFLNTLEGKCAVFAGLFHQTIGAYYDQFGRENVHVMLLEELEVNTEKALRQLCTFLHVPYVEYKSGKKQQNQGKGVFAGKAISMLSRWGLSDKHISYVTHCIRPLSPLLHAVFKQDVISKREKAFLQAFYAASNFHTACLTGLDLKHFGYPI